MHRVLIEQDLPKLLLVDPLHEIDETHIPGPANRVLQRLVRLHVVLVGALFAEVDVYLACIVFLHLDEEDARHGHRLSRAGPLHEYLLAVGDVLLDLLRVFLEEVVVVKLGGVEVDCAAFAVEIDD